MNRKLKLLAVALSSVSLAMTASTALAHKHPRHHDNLKGEAMPCPTPCCPAPAPAPCRPCCDVPMIPCGFYVGADVGYDNYRINHTFTATDATLGLTTSGTRRFASNGWVGGLYAGYGQMVGNWFHLAGEVYGTDSASENSQSTTFSAAAGTITTSTKTQADWSYGVDLLPGVRVNCSTILYTRLGWNWTRFRESANITSGGVVLASGSTRRTQNGFHYGLGLETGLCNNLALRTEVNHSDFNSFRRTDAGSRTTAWNNQFMVGLSYYFA